MNARYLRKVPNMKETLKKETEEEEERGGEKEEGRKGETCMEQNTETNKL